jgi:hypothetical protein
MEFRELEGKFVRVMNEKLEDVHNLCKDTLKPYSVFYKVMHLPQKIHEIINDLILDFTNSDYDYFKAFEKIFAINARNPELKNR